MVAVEQEISNDLITAIISFDHIRSSSFLLPRERHCAGRVTKGRLTDYLVRWRWAGPAVPAASVVLACADSIATSITKDQYRHMIEVVGNRRAPGRRTSVGTRLPASPNVSW